MLPWAENIRHLLYRNGYGMAWENPGCIEPRGFGRLFLERLNEQHVQNWHARIEQSSRFEELNILNENSYTKKSKYLHCINGPTDRKIFTRLRIDMNILGMCQGRFKKQERTQRKCPFCNKIDTVSHFLLECKQYETERVTFASECSKHNLNFDRASPRDQLKILLNLKIKVRSSYPTSSSVC